MELFDRLQEELDKRPILEGISPTDLVSLPEPLGTVLSKVLRRGSITLSELSGELALTIDQTRQLAGVLVLKGVLTESQRAADEVLFGENQTVYRIRLARAHGRSTVQNIWQTLNKRADGKDQA